MPIASEVAIIGSATTAFGVHHERGYLDLLAEAAFGAVADAGLGLDRIESAWLGTAEPGLTGLVGDTGSAVAEAIGFAPRPVTRVANFCCTGMEAVRAAALDVAAGEHEHVLAIGAEKMRDVTSRGSLVARGEPHPSDGWEGGLRRASSPFGEPLHGAGVTRETLAKVSVKNHEHATRPRAHFARRSPSRRCSPPPRRGTLGRRLRSPMTAAAVAPPSTGRAADHYVVIRGFACGTHGYYTTSSTRRTTLISGRRGGGGGAVPAGWDLGSRRADSNARHFTVTSRQH
jgi:acetyl-CoA C-acetyltransferase